ncbi:hypothetical protein [Pseudomonas juntendi]|uniref:hypothetical protein n=1 Tax=Pseudomonas juntendi TaxID=2666183 RepID=UPI002118DE23|nr:hypothetical protein [Pseudomonas juntendi]
MSHYQFQPQKSFIARLYWQPRLSTQGQVQGVPIGDTGNGDSPFTSGGWLHADEDHYTDTVAPAYVISRRKFRTLFWFGCYETDGEYDFEIRAVGDEDSHPHWRRRGHRLDVSRNGYLALYSAAQAVGHDALAAGTMLWRLDGLAPEQLAEGDAVSDVSLVSLHGKTVRRLVEDGFPYLSEVQGEAGYLHLQVLSIGAA